MSAKAGGAAASQPSAQEASYDELPYESYVYAQTHPDRMASIARLFKLTPPDIYTARVLEIGCAGGGNLIPIALQYPKSLCLGMDISGEQIAEANAEKAALNIQNITFQQGDITTFPRDSGPFDYIICHGVFSWVPEFVSAAILDVCKSCLSPNGFAVVSYNTLPGWSAVKSLRDMMIYHTAQFTDVPTKIREARNLLSFILENMPEGSGPYRDIVERERKLLSTTNDSYVFHEHLEAENHQFYLSDFAALVQKHGMAYIGDVDVSSMYVGNLSPGAQQTLNSIKDVVRQEQYMDFLTNRRFRHSIITHPENAAKVDRTIQPSRIFDFYVQAKFQPDGEEDAQGLMKFTVPATGAHFTTKDPHTTVILKALAAKRRPIKLSALRDEFALSGEINPETVTQTFHKNGFSLVLQGYMTLHEHGADYTETVSEKPRAAPWAHRQAQRKIVKLVTNQKRELVTLDPYAHRLLSHLDGVNTRDDILDKLIAHAKKGDLKVNRQNETKDPITDEDELRKILGARIESTLKMFAANALLVA